MSLRFQRLVLILITLTMILAAILLILNNVRENISYFYTPSEINNSNFAIDKRMRIGGFVEKNSFNKISSSSFRFRITDEKKSIPVTFNGTSFNRDIFSKLSFIVSKFFKLWIYAAAPVPDDIALAVTVIGVFAK